MCGSMFRDFRALEFRDPGFRVNLNPNNLPVEELI